MINTVAILTDGPRTVTSEVDPSNPAEHSRHIASMEKEVKGMRFTCSEQWQDMRPMGKDRFCMSCQKPVIDFTDWERDALIAYFKERPVACGQFRAEQVDPTLIPLPKDRIMANGARCSDRGLGDQHG